MQFFDSIDNRYHLDSLEWTFVAISGIFFLAGIAAVITLFVSRITKSYYTYKEQSLRDSFSDVISSVVVNEGIPEQTLSGAQFGAQLNAVTEVIKSSAFARDVLIKQLLQVKKNLTGKASAALTQLYYSLNLEDASLKKLNDLEWNIKVQGMRELAEMKSVKGLGKISTFLNSRNQFLREEAFMAVIRIDEKNPFAFLQHYDAPITPWMRINIFHFLQQAGTKKLPLFSTWFHNANQSIAIFSLTMVKQFRQRDAIPHVAAMLNGSDPELIAMAIETLSELDAYDHAEEVAKVLDRFGNRPEVAIQVAKCLAKIATAQQQPYLERLLLSVNHAVRFEAVKALKLIDLQMYQLLKDQADPRYQTIFLHLEEPLLQ